MTSSVGIEKAPTQVRTANDGLPWRVIFAGFALMMSVNAFYAVFQGPPADFSSQKATVPSNRDNLLYVGLWLVLYGASAWLVLRNVLKTGFDYRVIAITPFATYIALSAFWADNTAAAIVPACMLTLDIVIAAALAATVHPDLMLTVFVRLNVGLMAISLGMLAIDPAAVMSDPTRPGVLMPGELFGAYGNKSNLGNAAAISLVILLFRSHIIATRWRRLVALLIFGLGLILSNSAASESGGMIAAAALMAVRLAPAFRRLIFGVTSILAVLWSFSLPFISLGDVTQVLGRSSDVTGRGTFWPMAPGFILERPFLGYGYRGFFDAGPYSRAWDLWKYELYFFTPEFHNTLLDILISFGLIGGFAYVTTLAVSLGVFAHRALDTDVAEMLAAILIVFTIGAASEFKFLAHNSLPTLLLFYCFFVGGRRYAPSPWLRPGSP